jgi:guanine nucleotide-binding protein subunit beta-2-like 1 protein
MVDKVEKNIETECAGILIGHGDLITSIIPGNSVKENEESNLLITGSRDKSILVWNLQPANVQDTEARLYGKPLHLLKGHSHFITDLSLANENNFLLSSSWDKTLRLWDIRTGKSSKLFCGHTKEVLTVSFSPDNRQILSGGSDKDIKLWNTLSECKFTFSDKPHTDWVSKIRFSPSQKNAYIASVGWDGFLKIWTTNFAIKYSVKAHDSFINALSITPNGSYIATGGKDGYAKIWNINDFTKPVKQFNVGAVIHAIAFNPKLQWVAVASENGFRVYDMVSEEEHIISNIEIVITSTSDDKKEETKKAHERKLACSALAWSATGMKLFAAFSDNAIRVYHINSDKKA